MPSPPCLAGESVRSPECGNTSDCISNSYLKARNPDLIVNAAAYTAVDQAESEPETAHALNARLPQILAEYAAEKGVWLIHYSSDYVYPGGGDAPWSEIDAPGPLSVYGQTKLDGDVAIQNSGANHLIFRTSWVYSARGRNFMKTMLRLGAEKETLSIVNDQHGSPHISAADRPGHCLGPVSRAHRPGRPICARHLPPGPARHHHLARIRQRHLPGGFRTRIAAKDRSDANQWHGHASLPGTGHSPAQLAPGHRLNRTHFRSSAAGLAPAAASDHRRIHSARVSPAYSPPTATPQAPHLRRFARSCILTAQATPPVHSVAKHPVYGT